MLGTLKSRPAVALVAFVVGAIVAAGVAWAAVPSSTAGTITACYPTSGSAKGSLRVIDYQAGAHCAAGQAMIKWQADGMRWRGTWSSTKTYNAADVVADSGSSYIATRTSTDVDPPNAAYWALMAAKGADGVTLCSGYPHSNIDWSIPGSTPGHGCNLIEANLSGQTLSGADLTNANLHSANLADANLSGATLIGADLQKANLTDANLHGVDLTDAAVDGANLTGVNAIDGNLTDASLTDADLTNALVEGANLTNVNLHDADLTGANFQASTLAGANITGVTWSHTTCPDATVSDSNGSSPESCAGHGGGL
jgi:hypothetical protein